MRLLRLSQDRLHLSDTALQQLGILLSAGLSIQRRAQPLPSGLHVCLNDPQPLQTATGSALRVTKSLGQLAVNVLAVPASPHQSFIGRAKLL